MTKFIILYLIWNTISFAQDMNEFDLNDICNRSISSSDSSLKHFEIHQNEDTLYAFDNGFCSHFLEQQFKINMDNFLKNVNFGIIPRQEKPCQSSLLSAPSEASNFLADQKEKWKIHLYVKHAAIKYFDSDVTFKTTHYNVELKDYSWVERTISDFDSDIELEQPNSIPFRVLNKHSNTYTIGLEKDGSEFFLSVFRARFSQPGNYLIGDREIVLNDNNSHQYIIELGYAKSFTLFENKLGNISFIPAISSGIMVGSNRSADIQLGQPIDEALVYKSHFGKEGYGVSLANRLQFTSKNQRLKIYYENRLSDYVMNHSFLDGSESYNLGYMENIFGITFSLKTPSEKQKKKPSK